MALNVLQVPKGEPFVTIRYTLSGREYILRFEWNMRSGWFMGMSLSDVDVLFHPRRLVMDYDLLASQRHQAECPPGVLYALDEHDLGEKPGFEDLVSGPSDTDPQGRVFIIYDDLED